jgi:hypothetical protein
MLVLITAVLIAASVSDSLNDVRAWTLATIIGAAYIISRLPGDCGRASLAEVAAAA